KADTIGAARAWAEGDTTAGTKNWQRLSELGLSALLISEEDGGLGGSLVDLVVAHETLGYHLAVGPWVESSAYLALALAPGDALDAVASGALATVAVPPQVPRALDGDIADQVYTVVDGALLRASAE